jgi:hypothetical protein
VAGLAGTQWGVVSRAQLCRLGRINHQGIPITTVSRTLLDLAAQAREGELERALAQAERLQLYDHRAIQDVSARANESAPPACPSFRTDRAKDAALTASGYRVVRFTRDDEPDLAARRLRALLA